MPCPRTQQTSKLAGLFFTLSLFLQSAKQGSCEYHFLKSFGMTRLSCVHSFLAGNDMANELARRGALLLPSTFLCRLSPYISHIPSSLVSGKSRTVSSKIFNAQILSVSCEEIVLPRHARCVLSRLRCNGCSFCKLPLYLSIFRTAPYIFRKPWFEPET